MIHNPAVVWLAVVLAIYVAILVLVARFSVRPIRIPIYISPGGLGAPQEDVSLTASDGTPLRAWWVPAENSDTVAVFSHGYLMNRCELVPEAFHLWKMGISCVMLDLRVHGRSGGKVCTLGVKERLDVRAAVEFARSRIPDAKVVLIGSSMGSVASAMALAEDPSLADGLVLDSAYARMDRAILGWWRLLGGKPMAAFLWPTTLLGWPMTRINPFRFDLSKELPKIGEKPILFIHGREDQLAMPSEAERNFAAACGPKRFVWFEGCDHTEGRWQQADRYREAVLHFLGKRAEGEQAQ
jgi:pimeloyl-ACP methyl ester carboxylesterase